MDAKDKAEQLVNEYRILLMNEDTECGNEILCTLLAKQFALISCDFAKEFITGGLSESFDKFLYFVDVKEEINKL